MHRRSHRFVFASPGGARARSRGRLFLVPLALVACSTPERVDLALEESIVAAAGSAVPVRFRSAGPDGGPLDEPDAAGAELSFADAIQRALHTDPALQSALARVRASAAD